MTEATFHAHLQDTGDGPFLRTGDLGFMLDGELYVTGRLKDLIILRGVNYYPQDIELTVQRCHPRLRADCGAAFAVEKDGREQLVLVFEVERHKQGQFGEVFQAIRRAVAGEHDLNVDAIVLIRAGTVPKTSSGKIQRHACRQSYLDGTLDVVGRWQLGDAEEPLGEIPAPNRPAAGPKLAELAASDGTWVEDITAGEAVDRSLARDRGMRAGSPRHESTNGEPAAKRAGTTAVPSRRAGSGRAKAGQEDGRRPKSSSRRSAAWPRSGPTGMTLDSAIAESGMDSLERMEILATLEERFGGRFPPEILPELETTRQVIAAVQKYLGTEPRATSRALPGGGDSARDLPLRSVSRVPATCGSGSTCWRLPGWETRTSACRRESPTIGR